MIVRLYNNGTKEEFGARLERMNQKILRRSSMVSVSVVHFFLHQVVISRK